jgi:small-conductance mechanosensitive channel
MDITGFATLLTIDIIPIFWNVIYTIITILIAYIIKRAISDRIVTSFAKKTKVSDAVSKPIKKLFAVVIYIIAIIVILGIWNLKDITLGLLTGAGVIGIVIGFAAKDVFADILAGIILFFDRPFKIGEAIKIGDYSGKVEDIGLRSVKIKTWDGLRVTIPNSKVESEVVTNYSYYDKRRLDLVVGVDYGTDLKKATKVIRKVLKKKEFGILEDPEPRIMVDDFAPSSINLKILFWVSKQGPLPLYEYKSKLREEIKEAFKKNKIKIPFPHIEVIQRKK